MYAVSERGEELDMRVQPATGIVNTGFDPDRTKSSVAGREKLIYMAPSPEKTLYYGGNTHVYSSKGMLRVQGDKIPRDAPAYMILSLVYPGEVTHITDRNDIEKYRPTAAVSSALLGPVTPEGTLDLTVSFPAHPEIAVTSSSQITPVAVIRFTHNPECMCYMCQVRCNTNCSCTFACPGYRFTGRTTPQCISK